MGVPKGEKNEEDNSNEEKKAIFRQEYCEQAHNYCLLGATDKQLASFFKITEDTLLQWNRKHKKFAEAIRIGKEVADMQVAKSLFQNCIGSVVTKERQVKVKKIDPQTQKIIEEVEVVKLQDRLPPDTGAIKFWLTNRQAQAWRNKQETDHTTKGESINIIQLGKGIKPKK